ncbi:hypothetical protein SALBM311S_09170 [Streptomyces alboniger]
MPDVTKTDVKTGAVDPVGGAPAVPPVESKSEKTRSLWGDAWADLRRSWIFIISSVLIFFLLLITFFPGWFTSAEPILGDLSKHYLQKPKLGDVGSADWLGYDQQGRSVYARVIYGTRASIAVGFGTTILVTLVGSLMGMIAGYFGGIVDSILSRLTDVFFGIPFLLGTMVVLNSFPDRTAWVVIGALGFFGWTQISRVMRGAVITTKQADYVQAAKALGASTPRIMFRHILPNTLAPVSSTWPAHRAAGPRTAAEEGEEEGPHAAQQGVPRMPLDRVGRVPPRCLPCPDPVRPGPGAAPWPWPPPPGRSPKPPGARPGCRSLHWLPQGEPSPDSGPCRPEPPAHCRIPRRPPGDAAARGGPACPPAGQRRGCPPGCPGHPRSSPPPWDNHPPWDDPPLCPPLAS